MGEIIPTIPIGYLRSAFACRHTTLALRNRFFGSEVKLSSTYNSLKDRECLRVISSLHSNTKNKLPLYIRYMFLQFLRHSLLLAHPQIPPTRRQNTHQEFTAAFRAIDTNKDGSLDIPELQRLMAAMGCALTDHELQEIFGELDTDGSGKVDFEEFVDQMMNA